jgi:hypothetical protein
MSSVIERAKLNATRAFRKSTLVRGTFAATLGGYVGYVAWWVVLQRVPYHGEQASGAIKPEETGVVTVGAVLGLVIYFVSAALLRFKARRADRVKHASKVIAGSTVLALVLVCASACGGSEEAPSAEEPAPAETTGGEEPAPAEATGAMWGDPGAAGSTPPVAGISPDYARMTIAVHDFLRRFGDEQGGYGRYAYLVCKRSPSTSARNAAAVRAIVGVLQQAGSSDSDAARADHAITYVPVNGVDPIDDAERAVKLYAGSMAMEIANALNLRGEGPFIVVSPKPFNLRADFSVLDLSGIDDSMMTPFVDYYSSLMAAGVQWTDRPPYYEFQLIRSRLATLGSAVERGLDAVKIVGKVLAIVAHPAGSVSSNAPVHP